jgi:hypothetical protein
MRFLQYPWRWLEAVEAPMAVFIVAAIWPAARRARIAVLAACGAGFIVAILYAGTVFFQACYPEDTVASTLAAFHSGAGFEGMYEYEPPGADDSLIATGLPDACVVNDPLAELGKPNPDDPAANPIWTSARSGCLATFTAVKGNSTNPEHRELRATIAQPGYLVLRLLSYPAWSVRVNGSLFTPERLNTLPHRDDGLIVVPVTGGPVDLALDWTTTPDVVAGRWLSAISVLLLIALCLFELRRQGPRLT